MGTLKILNMCTNIEAFSQGPKTFVMRFKLIQAPWHSQEILFSLKSGTAEGFPLPQAKACDTVV